MNFEQNGSYDQKMLLLKYFKVCIIFFYSRHPDGREERQESNECPQVRQFNSTIRQFSGDSIIDKLLRIN